MAGTIYGLCAIAAIVCAVLLLRAYRKSGYRLLLWGGLCFSGLTVSNVLLVIDKLVLQDIDLSTIRYTVTLISVCILLYGLVWETE